MMRQSKYWRSARSQAGVSAIEYALLASLIVVVIIVGVTQFSANVLAMWNYVVTHVLGVIGGG
jgi:Flp pilus assembly pilin Flp